MVFLTHRFEKYQNVRRLQYEVLERKYISGRKLNNHFGEQFRIYS